MLQKVEVFEQPMSKGQRFRYKCEGKSAGSLFGVRSTQSQKSYPSIKVHNHNGPAAIVVSCVTKDEPYYPHPHNLVGQDCKNGVCTIRVKNCSNIIPMTNVGVQCCKRQDVQQHLREREDIQVDPFSNIKDIKKNEIDLGVVRLCFQVFLPDSHKKFSIPLAPVVSEVIIDKKCVQDLIIGRVSITSGSCVGGDEMFLLCEKVNKDDIQVRFYEETSDGIAWEEYGIFASTDVHRQCAIVLKTPPYKTQVITSPIKISLQLRKPSDGSCGEPIQFQYLPNFEESLVDSTQTYDLLCSMGGLFAEPNNFIAFDSDTVSTTTLDTAAMPFLVEQGGSSLIVNDNLDIQYAKFLDGYQIDNLLGFICNESEILETDRTYNSETTSSRKRPYDGKEMQTKKQKI